MNFLQGINLGQLVDYSFLGFVVFSIMLSLYFIGTIGDIRKDVRRIREESAYNQEILLSQIKVLKQIRDGRYR